MAYLSDRPVLMERDVLPPRRSVLRYPEYLAAHNIRFAVFPASAYRDKNPELYTVTADGKKRPFRAAVSESSRR